MYPFKNVIKTEDQLVDIIGTPHPTVAQKSMSYLNEHCQMFIGRSPFIVLASSDDQGMLDVSPKGDPEGFVRILDEKTLVIPDRLGNKRVDSFKNILKNPNVALIFLIPGKSETLRVAGTARIIMDNAILESMKVNDKAPKVALAIHVQETLFHCSKCMNRSKLWQPEHWPSIEGLPTLAQTMVAALQQAPALEELEQGVKWDEKNRLY